jgi:tetratricopeptide (TPR) repeat protein
LEEQRVHAVGTLCGYGFLNKRGNTELFDMHSLVHLATRIWIRNGDLTATKKEMAIRQLSAVFPRIDYVNRDLWREYLPHAFRALQHGGEVDLKEKSDLCYRIGQCLMVEGRIQEAIKYLEEACKWRIGNLTEGHHSRLEFQHVLAVAYKASGRVKEAIKLLKHNVNAEATTLPEDNPARLASRHEHALAMAYYANGQVDTAVELLRDIVSKREKLDAGHHSRLASQHDLAMIYATQGQFNEAVSLFKGVVAVRKGILAENHPSLLTSQHALGVAMSYSDTSNIDEAVKLLNHVVTIRKREYGDNHPTLCLSQSALHHILEIAKSKESTSRNPSPDHSLFLAKFTP